MLQGPQHKKIKVNTMVHKLTPLRDTTCPPGHRVWRRVHHGCAGGRLARVRLSRGLLLHRVSQRQGGSLREAEATLRSQQPRDAGRVARSQKGEKLGEAERSTNGGTQELFAAVDVVHTPTSI